LVRAIEKLAKSPSDDNRRACQTALQELVAAVDGFISLAGQPEFASRPAVLGESGMLAQEPLTSAGKRVITGSASLMAVAKALIANPKDAAQWRELTTSCKMVTEGCQALDEAMRSHMPGQRECDAAAYNLNELARSLDEAGYACATDALEPVEENSLEGYQEELVEHLAEITQAAAEVEQASTGEPQKLGKAIERLQNAFEPLVQAAVAVASQLTDRSTQGAVLAQARTLLEAGLELTNAAREAGGNPQLGDQQRSAVEAAVASLQRAAGDFSATLASSTAEAGVVAGQIKSIQRAVEEMEMAGSTAHDGASKADKKPAGGGEDGADSAGAGTGGDDGPATFADYQESMTGEAKALSRSAQDIISRAMTDPSQVGLLAQELTDIFMRLTQTGAGAVGALKGDRVAGQLIARVRELGEACGSLVQSAALVQSTGGNDAVAKRELAETAKACTRNVNGVLAALQAGSRGTQACLTAASAVDGVMLDLETTAMFAAAGALGSVGGGLDEGGDAKDAKAAPKAIRTAGDALLKTGKVLASSHNASQDVLEAAAEASRGHYVAMVDALKNGMAGGLGGDNMQGHILLLNAAKDIGQALGGLLHDAKKASGRAPDESRAAALSKRAQKVAASVTVLLKAVDGINSETALVTNALSSAAEAIRSEAR
jgi:talin